MKSITQRQTSDATEQSSPGDETLPESVHPDSTDDDGLPIVLESEAHQVVVRRTSVVIPVEAWSTLAAWADEESEVTWTAPRRRDPRHSIGRVIGGRYRLGPVIGAGGMGTVLQATHTETRKRVAVKVLAPAFDHDDEAKDSFRREAMTASALESDHIAQVFDVGEDIELGLYMVMEYLSGEDLAHHLAERGPLSAEAAARIVWQVCLALEHAHAAGVVHRDLKPANVFLTRADDGSAKVKVVDFGIAKRVREPRQSVPGGLDLVVGTPRYMSPEQAQGLPSVNHLSDVYSLGSLLFEAIAGSSAYPRLERSKETLAMILSEDPPRLASRAQGVPPELDDLVAALMSRDPSERPASAREVRHRLAAICSRLAQRSLAPSGPPPSVPLPLAAVEEPRSGRWQLVAVAVLGAVLGLAFAVWLLGR